jgi:hypothetical protein
VGEKNHLVGSGNELTFAAQPQGAMAMEAWSAEETGSSSTLFPC